MGMLKKIFVTSGLVIGGYTLWSIVKEKQAEAKSISMGLKPQERKLEVIGKVDPFTPIIEDMSPTKQMPKQSNITVELSAVNFDTISYSDNAKWLQSHFAPIDDIIFSIKEEIIPNFDIIFINFRYTNKEETRDITSQINEILDKLKLQYPNITINKIYISTK